RKPMTIAAGFVCSDGLVLFADTEEQEGYIKTNVEKIQKYPHSNCSLLIANAGNGFLADSLIDRIFDALPRKKSEAEIVKTIRKTIIDFHASEVALYPDTQHRQVGLILGIQLNGKSLLLHADSTALRRVKEFAVIGYGVEIKFLAQQLYIQGMPIKHGVLIANYLVDMAKKHVQGCGGESRIATLNDKGAEIMHNFDVWGHQFLFSHLATIYRAVLLSIPDEEITDDQFKNCLDWFVEMAWRERTDMLQTREYNREALEHMNARGPIVRGALDRWYRQAEMDTNPLDRRRKMIKPTPRVN